MTALELAIKKCVWEVRNHNDVLVFARPSFGAGFAQHADAPALVHRRTATATEYGRGLFGFFNMNSCERIQGDGFGDIDRRLGHDRLQLCWLGFCFFDLPHPALGHTYSLGNLTDGNALTQ